MDGVSVLSVGKKTEVKRAKSIPTKITIPQNEVVCDLGSEPWLESLPTVLRDTVCACGGGYPCCDSQLGDIPISAPDDPFERQADQVAEQVMQSPPQVSRKPAVEASSVEKPGPDPEEVEQDEGLEEEPWLQRKPSLMGGSDEDQGNNGSGKLLPLNGKNGAGQANILPKVGVGSLLASGDRQFFESQLCVDLGGVRLHSNQPAAAQAESVNAHAFTVVSDIVFGNREYIPGTQAGRSLLAHELAHVTQQNRGLVRPNVQRLLRVIDPSEPPAHLQSPDGRTLRVVLVEGWLGQVCPSGVWRVDRAQRRATGLRDRASRVGHDPDLCRSLLQDVPARRVTNTQVFRVENSNLWSITGYS